MRNRLQNSPPDSSSDHLKRARSEIIVQSLNFLPLVARRKRKQLLNQVSAFLEMEQQSSLIRLWTLTGGSRFPMFGGKLGRDDFRKRWSRFHKRINRLSEISSLELGEGAFAPFEEEGAEDMLCEQLESFEKLVSKG